ncbi:PaaI family thioesterase [Streptomyces sp. NPDC055092]
MTIEEELTHRQPLEVKGSGPERLLQIGAIAATGDTVSSSMATGRWLNGPEQRPLAGSLGVLVDNVLGYAIMLDRPRDRWSVSSEISIDLCRALPADGSRLRADAQIIHSDSRGGIATGNVTDATGRLIAVCRQHGRWAPPPVDRPAPAGGGRRHATNLLELIDAQAKPRDDGAELHLVATVDLVNPLGNLHGGIALCASDAAAHAALHSAGRSLDTASVHISYLRPVPLGTVMHFDASLVHQGRSFAVVSVTATNTAGKPCTTATVTAAARPEADDGGVRERP